jgi:ABC-type dipeptide/oligopeptide/nickel transport system permease component
MTTHLNSPSAWMTRWKNGWDQPTNTAARLGNDFGHYVLPALVVFAVVVFFVARMARRKT